MDRDSSPKRNGCACRAGSLYYTDWLYLCQKSWIFRFFPQILLPVSSAGEKTIPPPPGGASTAAGEKPQQKGKDADPQAGRRKRYCFGSLIPTTPFCHNKTGELPFLQQHFFFFSNNRHKNVSFAPKRRKNQRPAQKRKANRIAAIGFSPWHPRRDSNAWPSA